MDGRVVTVEARVASDPEPLQEPWDTPCGPSSMPGGTRPENCRLGRTESSWRHLGDRVRVELKLSRLDPLEPFDARLARKGVAAKAVVLSPLEVVEKTSNPLLAATN